MRVLYLQGGAERAGAERMLLYLLKYIDRDRYVPAVAFMSEGPFIAEVEDLGVKVIRAGQAPRLRNIPAWPLAVQAVAEAAVDHGADLVHANGEKMANFAARAARGIGVPSIAWLHDAPGAGGMAGLLAQTFMKRARPSAVITCSQWMAHAFNDRYAMGAEAITNGIDLESLPGPNSSVKQIRSHMGWGDETVIVSHFARLQRWKGTHVFLEAAATVAAESLSARFLVVGDALFGREMNYAQDLRKLASDLGLDRKLLFTGFRDDALEIMEGSDVVVHCSLTKDPFPTVVLEAMVLGRAVVATRTGGPEEAIDDKETGILVESGNVAELADAISRLVGSKDLRLMLGSSAEAKGRRRFSAARMASEFEELYQRLVPASKAAS